MLLLVGAGGPGPGTDVVIPGEQCALGVVPWHPRENCCPWLILLPLHRDRFACVIWSEEWGWLIVLLQQWQSSAGLPKR